MQEKKDGKGTRKKTKLLRKKGENPRSVERNKKTRGTTILIKVIKYILLINGERGTLKKSPNTGETGVFPRNTGEDLVRGVGNHQGGMSRDDITRANRHSLPDEVS